MKSITERYTKSKTMALQTAWAPIQRRVSSIAWKYQLTRHAFQMKKVTME